MKSLPFIDLAIVIAYLAGMVAVGLYFSRKNPYAEQFNNLAKKGMSPDMAHEVITLAMALDTTRDAAEKGNVIISTTNPNELVSQLQGLGKTLTKPAGAQPANDTTPKTQVPKLG